jgi:hypothetical protein
MILAKATFRFVFLKATINMNSNHTKMNVGEIFNNEYIKMLCSMNNSSALIPRVYFLSGQKSLRALKGNINKRDRGGDLEWADNSTGLLVST